MTNTKVDLKSNLDLTGQATRRTRANRVTKINTKNTEIISPINPSNSIVNK